jgi:hypothetical protein
MSFSRASVAASALSIFVCTVGAHAAPPKAPKPPKAATSTLAPLDKPVDMDSLLTAFARMPGLEAQFTEEKHIALLAKPLESKGVLYFMQPGLMLRRIDSPRPSEVLITPDSLRMKDAGGEQALDLRARADVRPFVESLTWILGGDRKALESVYALQFAPAAGTAPWKLTLTPKGKPVAQIIAAIVIMGRGHFVDSVEVRETGGDHALTRIVQADPKRVFNAEERGRLFGTGASDKKPGVAGSKAP